MRMEHGARAQSAKCVPILRVAVTTKTAGNISKWFSARAMRCRQSNGFLESVKLADVSLEVLESFAARIGGGLSLVDYKTAAECEFTAQDVRAEIERRKGQPAEARD